MLYFVYTVVIEQRFIRANQEHYIHGNQQIVKKKFNDKKSEITKLNLMEIRFGL